MGYEAHSAEQRPDTDDYDLLTYGEAAARLAETLREERRKLADLEETGADPAVIQRSRRRIELLADSDARYRQQSLSGAAFMQKFGFRPQPPESGATNVGWD